MDNNAGAVAPMNRNSLKTLLLSCAATVALWFVPLASFALYPLRLFVTFIHESSHALAALLTGGRVAEIQIEPDASGVTMTYGGFGLLIVMAGYLGATAYGAWLISLGRRARAAHAALYASAAVVGLATVLAVRPWHNFFGFVWGLIIAALLVWAGRRMSALAAERTVMFLGVQCVANALYDLKTLVGLSTIPNGPTTDAALMSQMIPLPPVVWAVLWSGAALGILWVALRPYWRRGA
ncbi:MAG: Peptidase M50B-like [Capsulimonas sp.]|nr:Peptidase M50B-like [Capsulimonas sp.]